MEHHVTKQKQSASSSEMIQLTFGYTARKLPEIQIGLTIYNQSLKSKGWAEAYKLISLEHKKKQKSRMPQSLRSYEEGVSTPYILDT